MKKYFIITKTEFLHFKITLTLANLDMVGSRWFNFFKWYSGRYPVNNFFIAIYY